MENPKRVVSSVALAGVVYLLLVSGGILPFVAGEPLKSSFKGVMLIAVLCVLYQSRFQRNVVLPLGKFLMIGLILGFLELGRSTNISFALEKIDGAILCSVAAAFILDQGYRRFGQEKFQYAFLVWAFLILIMTIVYKFNLGFFDRGIRFFLNGPIVFGWIMGLCGLIAFHLWMTERKVVLILMFFIFFIALLWTESKGSTLAFLVAWGIYVCLTFRKNIKIVLISTLSLIGIFLSFSDLLIKAFENSRFSALGRLFGGELGASDEGSVGVRSILSEVALRDFWSNPLFGIGLGEFHFGEYVYPHNQHLEVFAELGFFVGMLHVIFLIISLVRANPLNKAIIILFSVAASFSGDASYFRFLYAFCLLGFIRDGQLNQRNPHIHRERRAFRKNGSLYNHLSQA
jgi:hypothetical protein